jgi:hypothetical protein
LPLANRRAVGSIAESVVVSLFRIGVISHGRIWFRSHHARLRRSPLSRWPLSSGVCFRDERGFSLQYEQLPFAKHKSLTLRWGTWLARLSYEEGKKVVEDSAEISRILGPGAPPKLAGIDKRIRTVFGDDEAREYTNQPIHLMDVLRGSKGAIVFDPQQKDIIRPPEQKNKESTKSRH